MKPLDSRPAQTSARLAAARRRMSVLLLPVACFMALMPLADVVGLPVLHAHGGAFHMHLGGELPHTHGDTGADAPGWFGAPHWHAHLTPPPDVADTPVLEAHRIQHERMDPDDVLSRMVPIRSASVAAPPTSRAPAKPRVPAVQSLRTASASYCSLTQPAPEPGRAPLLLAPEPIRATPTRRPEFAPAPRFPSSIAGRAPPAVVAPVS